MNNMYSPVVQDGLKYIHETYAFMFERGYEVFSADDYEVGWQVVVSKPDLFVKILRTRGDDYVSFRTSTQAPDDFVDLGSVVYAATGEMLPVSGDVARELQAYINGIETYFESEYVKDVEHLQIAQREYRGRLPRVEAPSPKEAKIIPALYYPLMVIITLLLLGALITLGMVLLDRVGMIP